MSCALLFAALQVAPPTSFPHPTALAVGIATNAAQVRELAGMDLPRLKQAQEFMRFGTRCPATQELQFRQWGKCA